MTDTPDFDKMTPEEIMKWMESLAVRQGATEGLTTSADMDIGSVSEDDERLKDKGEYIPYGMKKEDWDKQKAKEDEQKRQRMASQPPRPAQSPTPTQSAPPPQPVQPAASAPVPPPAQPAPAAAQPAAVNDTPDFDNMSPDEIMKWMESLAKRQGAVEGFTTSADAEVADVSADDERLVGKGDYIPFGMKQADWDKQLAKEEEQKRARQSQQPPAAPAKPVQAQPPAASFMPPPPPEPVIQPPSALDDFLSGELPGLEIEEEETVQADRRISPPDWLSDISNPNTGDEFDFNNFSNELVGSDDDDDPFKALADLSSGDNNMDWLVGLGDDSGLDALANLADLGSNDDDPLKGLDFLNEPVAPSKPAAQTVGPQPGEDSLEWLESMARDHGASDEELMTPANLNVTRPNETRTDGPGYTPYSFETTSDVPDDAVPVSADLGFLNEDDGSPEDWLDDVARGVATGEMPPVKAAGSRTPDAAPKEEDVVDDVMAQLSTGKDVNPDDINKMFESLFKRAEDYAHLDEPLDETPAPAVPDDIPDEALKAEIPDWLRDQMITSEPDATPSPESDKMDALMQMFDEEAALSGDFNAQTAELEDDSAEMPDWMLAENEDDGLDVEVQENAGAMPDWLRQTPDDDIPALTSSEVPALVGEGELPDWLQVTDEEGSDENIFAEARNNVIDEDLGELIDSDDLEEVELPEDDRAFAMDSDPWVVALTLEEEGSEQLSQWYTEKTNSISSEDLNEMMESAIAQPTSAMASGQSMTSGSLKAAQLPIEAVLLAGEAQAAPDWLLGSAEMPAASVVMPSAVAEYADEEDIPDWLRQDTEPEETVSSTEMDDIPDWLRDQVDDSVVEGNSDLPPWLASEDVEEAEGDEIPDWLRETMAEEENASPSFTPDSGPSAPTVVMPMPNLSAVVPSTPAPTRPAAIQPVKSSPAPMVAVNIDVASTLQAARGKVSSGDLEGALGDYELIVRANTALDDVVKDLSKLVEHKDHKRNPTVYRVLGDTLMRRGELKIALETYRKALHML